MKQQQSFINTPDYVPDDPSKFIKVPTDFDGEIIDVIYRKGKPGLPMDEVNRLRAAGEQVARFSVLPNLNSRTYDAAPGIVCRQDVPVQMRDGITIYCDLYLPKRADDPLPLIIAWGPFGKRAAEGQDGWQLMGVPPGTVSIMAKFEACDPGFWCRRGYAVANVDPRGIGHSEGYMDNWGRQDGQDGYDFIEWAAQQEWCNGKCSLFGNSGVAMVQWRIAAENPPHLACFAAWEGTGDMYRESLCPGGIPATWFNSNMLETCAIPNYGEDSPNMVHEHPLIDKYWESKIPNWQNIKAPAYVTAGWCHIHLRGSFEGFRRIRSPKKWLRIHRDMEWPDSYTPRNLDDLQRFYDRYMKDDRNGWEFTPRVRIEVMDGYGFDYAVNRPEENFPIPRTQYKKLYLDAASMGMSFEEYPVESEIEYDPDTDNTVFKYTFTEDTEITGYMSLRLFFECRGYDNADMIVWVKKYGLDGQYVPVHCMGEDYRGAWSYYRATHRELDPKWSTSFQPVQAHRAVELLEPGEVYQCDIEIWPHSRFWHKGEAISVEVAGHFIMTEWYMDEKVGGGINFDNGEGRHVIHTGGKYASYLQIPVVPPKYQVGDYVYRTDSGMYRW